MKRKRNNTLPKKEEIWETIQKQERISPIFKVLGMVAVVFSCVTILVIKQGANICWSIIKTALWFIGVCLVIILVYPRHSS